MSKIEPGYAVTLYAEKEEFTYVENYSPVLFIFGKTDNGGLYFVHPPSGKIVPYQIDSMEMSRILGLEGQSGVTIMVSKNDKHLRC